MSVKQSTQNSFSDIYETLKTQNRESGEIELVKKAYDFAVMAHDGQARKSGEPYIIHPLAVANRLASMRLDAETIAAGLLHDVCEDTAATTNDIKKEFGENIAFLVDGVTKLGELRYRGSERGAENLRKMFLAVAEDIRVVLIKLADRLHNMETLGHVLPEKQKRIAIETLEIYAPLAYRLGIGEFKGRLEDLAFPYIYPEEYAWLVNHTKETFEERKAYTESLIPKINAALNGEKLTPVDIHARAKHLYSLYKKLLAYDMDIGKIHDLVAVRIIVKNLEDCYRALGVIHAAWKPLPGRIKDYIAMPKPNSYRSLHTTIFGPEGKVTEIQIRTSDMHEEAENGIAAHWAYSETNHQPGVKKIKDGREINKTMAWVKQLREWQKEFQNPEEFLESLKIDFFKDRIFVFTPKGDVIDLPDGSTPVDFAYQVHSAIGEAAVGAKVNGKMSPLDFQLSSGDVVEILTQKNKMPSRDWLEFVKTASARKKITAVMRKRREEIAFLQKSGTPVELRLTARDRIGLLKDVARVIADQKINMKNISSETKNRLCPAITIQIAPRSKSSLEKLLVRLKEIKGVEEVGYKLL